jgi:hypothetical protein
MLEDTARLKIWIIVWMFKKKFQNLLNPWLVVPKLAYLEFKASLVTPCP